MKKFFANTWISFVRNNLPNNPVTPLRDMLSYGISRTKNEVVPYSALPGNRCLMGAFAFWGDNSLEGMQCR